MPGQSVGGDDEGAGAGRPYMPGYPLLDASGGRGLLPWSWAEERLEQAHNYWLATARPDGAPHLMPLWGLWLDGRFCFSTGGQSRKARNLALDARCAVSTERADEAVIVEGVADRVHDPALLARFAAAYNAKYDWDIDPGSTEPIFAVRPRVAFGFIEDSEDFNGSATRWRFDD